MPRFHPVPRTNGGIEPGEPRTGNRACHGDGIVGESERVRRGVSYVRGVEEQGGRCGRILGSKPEAVQRKLEKLDEEIQKFQYFQMRQMYDEREAPEEAS